MEISCSTNANLKPKKKEKDETFTDRSRNLKLDYPDFKFRFISVIIGVLEYATHCLIPILRNFVSQDNKS